MGSGPVIITDDGGPPFTNDGNLRDLVPLVRVGRKNERMDSLTTANSRYEFNSGDIPSVKVTQKGNNMPPIDDPDLVQVLGSNGTMLTVRLNSGGTVEIDNDNPLVTDVDAQSGFVRYAENDSSIAKVWVDGKAVAIGNGNPVRVEIKIA
jgi:hypothetical protein